MGLCSVLLLMEDGSHPQIMLFCSECILHFSELNVSFPYRLRISLCPVGAQNVAAAALKRPLVAIFVFFNLNGQTLIFVNCYFRNSYRKERSSTAVSFQESSDPSFYLLPIPESSPFRLFL